MTGPKSRRSDDFVTGKVVLGSSRNPTQTDEPLVEMYALSWSWTSQKSRKRLQEKKRQMTHLGKQSPVTKISLADNAGLKRQYFGFSVAPCYSLRS